jgi:hypothetical protein
MLKHRLPPPNSVAEWLERTERDRNDPERSRETDLYSARS